MNRAFYVGPMVDWPTSSPYVTAVDGTTLAIGPANIYEFETAWGTLADPLSSNGKSWQNPPPGLYPQNYRGSGGGGVSTSFTQPSYQTGVVPESLATALPNGQTASKPMRVIPDVAALADYNLGMLIGETTLQPDGKTYAFATSKIGGTSVAFPTFAGIQADAQQAAGHPLGFANPAMYQRHGTRAFRDIVAHSDLAVVVNTYADPYTKTGPLYTYLGAFGIDGEGDAALPALKGYDDATGVGSPKCYIQSFMYRSNPSPVSSENWRLPKHRQWSRILSAGSEPFESNSTRCFRNQGDYPILMGSSAA